MKLNKIFAIALAALTLTACSDDDNDFNTASDVTVGMAQSEMKIPEDFTGTFYGVPVVLSGVSNGDVKITVTCTPSGNDGAVEEDHYISTSKTLTIPKGETSVSVEIEPISNTDANQDRHFTVKIESAKGAKIDESKATCDVVLVDNDRFIAEAYENVQGTWNLTGSNPCVLTITGFDEGDPRWRKTVEISGWAGYNWIVAEGEVGYDATTSEATVTMDLGQIVATDVDFGNTGIFDLALAVRSGNSIYTGGTIVATFDPEYKGATFDVSGSEQIYLVLYKNGSFAGYGFTGFPGASLVKG